MMNRSVTVRANLKFAPDVQIELNYPLGLSLACHLCQRTHRTIMIATTADQIDRTPRGEVINLSTNGLTAICTGQSVPTGIHPFPARIVTKEVTFTDSPQIIFQVEYKFQDFVDEVERFGPKQAHEMPFLGQSEFHAHLPALFSLEARFHSI